MLIASNPVAAGLQEQNRWPLARHALRLVCQIWDRPLPGGKAESQAPDHHVWPLVHSEWHGLWGTWRSTPAGALHIKQAVNGTGCLTWPVPAQPASTAASCQPSGTDRHSTPQLMIAGGT